MAQGGFVWGEGGQAETTSSRARRRLAEALLMEGTSTAPIQHWAQGLDRVAKALMGGYDLSQEDARERRQEQQANDLMASHPALAAAAPSGVDKVAAALTGSQPAAAAGDPTLPRGIRNNNPLNIESGAFTASQPGYTGTDGRFARFDTPEAGVAAASKLLDTYEQKHGLNTVAGIIGRWAPTSDGNNVSAYAANVSRQLGIDPNAPIPPEMRPRLIAAMGQHENGRPINMAQPVTGGAIPLDTAQWPHGPVGAPAPYGDASIPPNAQPAQGYAVPGQPAAAASGQMPPAIASWVRQAIRNPATRPAALQIIGNYAKPQDPNWKPIGKDADGTERYGFVDERARTVVPYTMPGAEPPTNSVIPPTPAGLEPKIWRKEFSERYTRGQLPATYEDTAKLRGEVQGLPSYKNLAQAAPVYKSMVDAASRDNRGSDVNLIYGMAKVMDPGSVVRESEMSVAQAIATLPQQLQQTVQSQLSGGGRLSSEVRAQIMREARSRIQAYQGMFDQDATMYRGIAQRNRANPEDIIPTFGDFPEWTPPALAPAPAAAVPAPAPTAATHIWDPQRGLIRKW